MDEKSKRKEVGSYGLLLSGPGIGTHAPALSQRAARGELVISTPIPLAFLILLRHLLLLPLLTPPKDKKQMDSPA